MSSSGIILIAALSIFNGCLWLILPHNPANYIIEFVVYLCYCLLSGSLLGYMIANYHI